MLHFLLKLLTAAYLAVCTASDMKTRKVWWPASAAVAAAGLLIHLFVPGMHVMQSLAGMLPGLALLGLSAVAGAAVGKGDAFVLCACGSLLELRTVCEIFFFGLILAAAWSVLLLIRGKATRKTFIPFMPFLLTAHLAVMLLNL